MQVGEELSRAVYAAEARIRDLVRRTPVERSPSLSAATGAEVFLKLENLQRTGSFKLRGAANRILALSPEERARGVVAASSGNHGAAVACAAQSVGCPATVFVPEGAAASKLDLIRSMGVEVVQQGEDCVVSEAVARRHGKERGATYVSPYNDPWVVAGQGTVAVELCQDLDGFDAVLIALGGGGLTGGVGGLLKSEGRDVEVVACSPVNSCVMHRSLDEGRVLDLPSEPTLSDGTAGGVESDSITFPLCQEVVDHRVLVAEDEIREAVRHVVARHHTLIEGAAGVAVAGLCKEPGRYTGRRVVVILCGANVDPAVLKEIL